MSVAHRKVCFSSECQSEHRPISNGFLNESHLKMQPEKNNQEISYVGIDIAKIELEVHCYDAEPKLPERVKNNRA